MNTAFFDAVRATMFSGKLTQAQVNGMNVLLDAGKRYGLADPHHMANVLSQRLTFTDRVSLLERDRARQPRALTKLVEKVGRGFSNEQLTQDQGGDARGTLRCRAAAEGHQPAVRGEDFHFLRRWRLSWGRASKKVGGAILGGATSSSPQ